MWPCATHSSFQSDGSLCRPSTFVGDANYRKSSDSGRRQSARSATKPAAAMVNATTMVNATATVYAPAVHPTAVNATAIYATAVPDRGVAHYVGAAASIWPPVKAQTTSSRDQRHIGALARNR